MNLRPSNPPRFDDGCAPWICTAVNERGEAKRVIVDATDEHDALSKGESMHYVIGTGRRLGMYCCRVRQATSEEIKKFERLPMQLPTCVRNLLVRWARWYSARRPPDNPINGNYLHRWYVTPWSGLYRGIPSADKTRWQRFVTRLPGIYLHKFGRSDYDRALHDHPWPSMSIILRGGYYEHVPEDPNIEYPATVRIWRNEGQITTRSAGDRHRIELPEGSDWVWTLFITGRRRRLWGFYCREGWREYREWERNGGCD